MREGFKNWLLLFSMVTIIGIIAYFSFGNKEVGEESILGVSNVSYKYAPYIRSIAPVSANVGEQFEYNIVVSDLDTPEDQVSIYLVEKPIWMYISDNKVLGVPTEPGTYKFIVSASDGSNSTSQINYVLVESNE